MKPLTGLAALLLVILTLALLLTGCSEDSGWSMSPGGIPANSAPASGE